MAAKKISEPERTKIIYNKENRGGYDILIQPFNERDELLRLYIEHLQISFNYIRISDDKIDISL